MQRLVCAVCATGVDSGALGGCGALGRATVRGLELLLCLKWNQIPRSNLWVK